MNHKLIQIGLCWLLLLPQISLGNKLDDQRQAFLMAEKYLSKKNSAGFEALRPSLMDYPLYPYLRYQLLKDHLRQTDQILDFLTTYKDTRYTPLLRSKWLDLLAEQERWHDFIQHYQVNDNSGDDCQWHWAKFQTGKQQEALIEAKRLWLLGKQVDKPCYKLFTALENSSLLTPGLIWQRFEAALANNQAEVAKATAPLLKGGERLHAETWLILHQNPKAIEDQRYWPEKNAFAGRLFAHASKRLAKVDLEKAMVVWDAKHKGFPIDSQIAQSVERKLGHALLAQKDNRAYGYLKNTPSMDEEDRAAKVRAALLERNWQHIDSALAELTASERQEPKWRYWQARTLVETGRKQQAQLIFESLAKDRSYYGFLAADIIKAPYQISDTPAKVSNEQLKQIAEQTEFKACQEFKWFNRDAELKRQWQFAIKHLPKDKLLTAAKLAQQWGLDQIAITTLVKADYWDDMELRFPLRYLDEVNASAALHQLDSSLIYGLMRQESMLDKTAASSAGALGLMQLMPDTARNVAKALNEPWKSSHDLYNPGLNIRYGSYYFKELLSRFGNHLAITSAAYNAGPHRAKKWLPTFISVPADIWIETIPFKETRKYVSTVLSYAIIYQQRLKKTNLKLKELLRDIAPE